MGVCETDYHKCAVIATLWENQLFILVAVSYQTCLPVQSFVDCWGDLQPCLQHHLLSLQADFLGPFNKPEEVVGWGVGGVAGKMKIWFRNQVQSVSNSKTVRHLIKITAIHSIF